MLIITLYARMSEYTEKTIVINRPMSLSFHIPHSPLCGAVTRANNSAVEAPSPDAQAYQTWGEVARCPSLARRIISRRCGILVAITA
jgi:hypothetical protein